MSEASRRASVAPQTKRAWKRCPQKGAWEDERPASSRQATHLSVAHSQRDICPSGRTCPSWAYPTRTHTVEGAQSPEEPSSPLCSHGDAATRMSMFAAIGQVEAARRCPLQQPRMTLDGSSVSPGRYRYGPRATLGDVKLAAPVHRLTVRQCARFALRRALHRTAPMTPLDPLPALHR